MPSSYRCVICAINWPYSYSDYSTCPGCGEDTVFKNLDVEPLSTAEAKVKAKQLKFERYYKQRGEREYDPMEDKDKKRGERHLRAIARAEAQQEVLLMLRDIPFMDDHPPSGG